MAFTMKPVCVWPVPPYGAVVRGTATTFTLNSFNQAHTQVAVQISNNRTYMDTLSYWYWNGSTLTSGYNAAGNFYANTTDSVSFGSTAFNSLTEAEGYRWRVRLYTNTPFSTYSDWSDWVYFATEASSTPISIASPGTSSNTRQPVIVWSNTNSKKVVAVRAVIVWAGTTVFDQVYPVLVSMGQSDTLVLPYDHTEGQSYTVTLTPIMETGALANSTSTTYKVSVVRFPEPTVGITTDSTSATLTCTQPSGYPEVATQDVYRWSPSRQTFVELATGLSPSFSLVDTKAPLNTPFWYRIVSNATSEGMTDIWYTPSATIQQNDWVITDGTTRLVVVVTSSSFTRETITEEKEPLGRQRKVINQITTASRTVGLTIDIDDDERSVIDSLYAMTGDTVWILSPFGDSFMVRITDIQVTDLPIGRASVTISCTEEGES